MVMQKGWIKLHRTLEEHPFWLSEKFTKPQAWIDLILLANHADGFFFVAGRKVPVKRGQVGRSLLTLGKRWNWSRGKVERYMEFLEGERMIVLKTGQHNSIVTICNYNTFQNDDRSDSTPDDATDGHQIEQQTDTRQGTNKNVNNVNNGKKITYSDLFQDFWLTYPGHRRGNKKRAYIEWQKIEDIEYPLIIENVKQRMMSDPDWLKDNGKYISHAERFLSGVRWQNPFSIASGQSERSIKNQQAGDRFLAEMRQNEEL